MFLPGQVKVSPVHPSLPHIRYPEGVQQDGRGEVSVEKSQQDGRGDLQQDGLTIVQHNGPSPLEQDGLDNFAPSLYPLLILSEPYSLPGSPDGPLTPRTPHSSPRKHRARFYSVVVGRQCGVFDSW